MCMFTTLYTEDVLLYEDYQIVWVDSIRLAIYFYFISYALE